MPVLGHPPRCFGCGEDLSEEGERCHQCGLDIHLLKEIGVVHSKPRFLFGRVETPVNLSSAEEEIDLTNDIKKPPRRATKKRKKPKSQKPVISDLSQASDPQSVPEDQDNDPILFRDEGLDLGELDVSFLEQGEGSKKNENVSAVIHPHETMQWPMRLGTLTLNILLLLLLNSAVIYIISLMTNRTCSLLMRYSFLPLILVHLAFSVIVLSLFYYFYGHSPGKLALRRFRS